MRLPAAISALLLSLTICAYAQETPAPKTQEDQQTVTAGNYASATVYFYRYKQYVGSALSPSVYCDEGELARMENGRYFVAKVAPGKHVFRSNDKQSGIEAEFKGGQEYYIRVELVTGAWKGHGRLTLVQPEQGSYEVKKLKVLDEDKVKDHDHVTPVAASR
ncbi:DUF2846 domain-containing protein [Occallatibacter savannae]|uniref:DUF2846 domain-containing protein n=1 Tax=Occallatibacter savannae TaxID=1002691 RepID=UPI0013A581B3|nr:DUF2846 domain-containing protein [Occallatibacter savannae]